MQIRTPPPVKPRCALKIAVVGNRRFAGEPADASNAAADTMKAHARAALEVVWQVLAASMQWCVEKPVPVDGDGAGREGPAYLGDFFSSEPLLLDVLGSLAAGGDQIAAQTAIDAGRTLGGNVEVKLEALLPFAQDDYPGGRGDRRPEFRPGEADELVRLVEQADQVIRMDGCYDDSAGRLLAYRQCRDMMLQHCDLLVAVYDPCSEGSPAGTLETVGLALAGGHPVIAVLVAEEEARIAVYGRAAGRPDQAEDEWRQACAVAMDPWRRELADQVERLLVLPHMIDPPGEEHDDRRLHSLGEAIERLRLISGESQPHGLCESRLLRGTFGRLWAATVHIGAFFAPRHGIEGHPRPAAAASDAITLEPYSSFYRRASGLSTSYMQTYRGAFVSSFALAGLAVSIAVLLMTLEQPQLGVVLGLGGVKIVVLLTMLGLERSGHSGRFQEHATEFRYLAELLRSRQWLAPVGAAVPAASPHVHTTPLDPGRGWAPWLLRAIMRGAPVVLPRGTEGEQADRRNIQFDREMARATLERARSEWVEGQIVYHWKNTQRMGAIRTGLQRLAKILILAVLAAAAGAWFLESLDAFEPLHDMAERFHPLAVGLTALTAVLPAFIAALAGIMFQSEAKRLELRSQAMYHGLRMRKKELDDAIANLNAGQKCGEAWRSALLLQALAEMMIEEAGDWTVLYQTHEIHAG